MNNELKLYAEKREECGSSASRRLRRNGQTPAVVYGHGQEALPIVLDEQSSLQLMHFAGLLTLEVNGQKDNLNAIIKDIQYEPIAGQVLHIDLQEVKADETITATVVIEGHGVPAGQQHGGQLEQVLHELTIECLPTELIELLEVDVSALELNESLLVSDLVTPEEIEVLSDPETLVFQVRLPTMEIPEPEDEEELEEELLEGEERIEGEEGEAEAGEGEAGEGEEGEADEKPEA